MKLLVLSSPQAVLTALWLDPTPVLVVTTAPHDQGVLDYLDQAGQVERGQCAPGVVDWRMLAPRDYPPPTGWTSGQLRALSQRVDRPGTRTYWGVYTLEAATDQVRHVAETADLGWDDPPLTWQDISPTFATPPA